METLEMVLGDDKSDQTENVRHTCMASLPSETVKERVWAEITDPNSTDSLYVKQAKMNGFYAWDQLDLTRVYNDRFFEVLPVLSEKFTYKQLTAFFWGMLPKMEVTDSAIVKLVMLKM